MLILRSVAMRRLCPVRLESNEWFADGLEGSRTGQGGRRHPSPVWRPHGYRVPTRISRVPACPGVYVRPELTPSWREYSRRAMDRSLPGIDTDGSLIRVCRSTSSPSSWDGRQASLSGVRTSVDVHMCPPMDTDPQNAPMLNEYRLKTLSAIFMDRFARRNIRSLPLPPHYIRTNCIKMMRL